MRISALLARCQNSGKAAEGSALWSGLGRRVCPQAAFLPHRFISSSYQLCIVRVN